MRVLILVAMLGISFRCHAVDAVKVIPPAQKILAAENGRYVFGQISEFQRDQYLLDTQTGRLWRVVAHTPQDENGIPVPGAQQRDVLQAVHFRERTGRESAMPMSDLTADDAINAFGGNKNKK